MNCCRETAKTAVPARHHARHASKARRAGREPARSGEAGGPPGNSSRGTAGLVPRGVPERYVAGADTGGHQEGRPNPRS